MAKAFKVKAGDSGRRLDIVLADQLGGSRSQWQKRLAAGDITVDGAAAKPSWLVQTGQSISVSQEAQPAVQPKPAIPELPVMYEDDDLLVIDKPAGLATHPGPGIDVPTVADFARTKTTDTDPERPGLVHRLDKDTSGLLVIAKTPAAKTYMQNLFKNHQVKKTYLALLRGQIDPPAAVIKLPIGRCSQQPLKRAVKVGGKMAETPYHTVRVYPGTSLVQAEPTTGRTHQLRVHFAALGHPIVGDTVYGEKHRPAGLSRQFLHATQLEFAGLRGQLITVTSPLPNDLQAYLSQLSGV